MMTLPIDEVRLESAVQKAEDAFWAQISKEYPEVTSGDLDPATSFYLQQNMTTAVRWWLWSNHPDHRG